MPSKATAIYSANGKEIFPRNGMIIPTGSFLKKGNVGEFEVLTEDFIFRKTRTWNNLCQSWEEETTLIPVKK